MPGRLVFKTAASGSATERMRIASNGNVGIGHDSPDSLLTIGGDVITTTKPTVAIAPDSGNGSLTIRRGSPTIFFDRTASGTPTIIYDSSSSLIFKEGSLDSSSERLRIQSGGGISFNGDTAAVNALDDYEEGNWTPAMDNGGWTGFTINKAKYVKVGALVFVQCYVSALTGSGNGGALKLSGLPYLPNANGYTTGAVDFGKGGKKGAYVRTETNTTKLVFTTHRKILQTLD